MLQREWKEEVLDNLVISDETWTMGNVPDNQLNDIWFSDEWLPFRGGTNIDDPWKCRNCTKHKMQRRLL